MKRPVPKHERGAALLAVLILVAVTGAIAAASMEKLRLSRLTALNVASVDQARQDMIGAERLAVLIVDDITAQNRSKTTLVGGWNGATRRIPMPTGGLVEARLRDGGNCFNINSVVQGNAVQGFTISTTGVTQFVQLMRLTGVPDGDAVRIAAAAADWTDSDIDEPQGGGAEDGAYAGGDRAYRTGNTLFADVSELRALSGMTEEAYRRIRPYVCALPVAELSPINVNTLLPEQAALLSVLAPQITVDIARRVLASRPGNGWENASEFFRNELLVRLAIDPPARQQVQVRTDWFVVDVHAQRDGADIYETVLIDSRLRPPRIVARRWERDETALDPAAVEQARRLR